MNVNTILIIAGATATDYIVIATCGSEAAGVGGVYRKVNEGSTGSWTKQSSEGGWDHKLKRGSPDNVYLLRSKAATRWYDSLDLLIKVNRLLSKVRAGLQ